MSNHRTLDPGQRCALDTKAYHMVNECGAINDYCYRCGWNPIVHELRVKKIREMNRDELSELFMAASRGEAWKDGSELK